MPTSTDTTATAVTDEAASRLPKLIAWLEGRMMFKEAADVRAILTAALPHIRQAAEPVAIKPLEWSADDSIPGRFRWKAGDYSIQKTEWTETLTVYDVARGNWLAAGPQPTLEAAKAAAQADYEARIRSALASPAQQEPVAYACKADIDALTPGGADVSLSKVAMPQYGMRMPLYASPAPDMRAEPEDWLDAEERRERKLATVVAPDNGTPHEVISAVLECARAWVPEARIIGNVRAGDIARAIEALPSPAPDMREVVLALEAAHPHLETLHSITSGEGRKIVWAVIKQVRAALHTRGDASHG